MGAPLQSNQEPKRTPQNRYIGTGILFMLFLSVLLYLYRREPEKIITNQKSLNWEDVAYIDEHGELQLKEWRLQELDKKIDEFEQAEQYALVAKKDGYYVCYHCSITTCFLQQGMVWKYGVTRKGAIKRYPGEWLANMHLDYIVQFRGTNHECLIEEKRKIFLYPLHFDNQIRESMDRMARPPGNKNDN
jgi:hypothetical protein